MTCCVVETFASGQPMSLDGCQKMNLPSHLRPKRNRRSCVLCRAENGYLPLLQCASRPLCNTAGYPPPPPPPTMRCTSSSFKRQNMQFHGELPLKAEDRYYVTELTKIFEAALCFIPQVILVLFWNAHDWICMYLQQTINAYFSFFFLISTNFTPANQHRCFCFFFIFIGVFIV